MEGIKLGRPRAKGRGGLGLMVLAIAGLLAVASIPANRDVEALSKMGSRGSESAKSDKLNWGYYKGNVDGIFGENQHGDMVSAKKRAEGGRDCRPATRPRWGY